MGCYPQHVPVVRGLCIAAWFEFDTQNEHEWGMLVDVIFNPHGSRDYVCVDLDSFQSDVWA